MEKQKNNNVLYSIIGFLSALVLLLGGYLIYDKVLKDEDISNNKTNNVIENDDETNDFSLDLLKGLWGICTLNELNNRVCYIKDIEKKDNKYIYRETMYQTDGFIEWEITNFNKLDENKYQLELYSAASDGPISSHPEKKSTKIVDIANINNKIIYIDDTKYEYITENASNTSDIEQYFRQ